jgi:alanine racemase
VFELAPGDAVGYGGTYVATEPRRAALVGIGYGDGFRRALGGRASVLVNGQRAPVLGRVSMDQIVVDVSGLGEVGVGDLVTLVGRQAGEEIGAGEMAALVDTIPYEIVTGLAPRLPRVYMLHGRAVGVSDLLGHHQWSTASEDAIFRAGTVSETRWATSAD